MLLIAMFYSLTVLATCSLPEDRNNTRSDPNLTEIAPLCTVSIANETTDCELRFNHDCCAEEGILTPYLYQKINDTAVTFTLSNNKTDHMFYLTKGCNTNYSLCVTIQISIPERSLANLQAKRLEAIAKISKLQSELEYRLFLATKHILPPGLHVRNDQSRRAECYAVANTSMHRHVRSDKLTLTKIPSPDLKDRLAANLVESSCNYSCLEGMPQNCNSRIVEVKQWPQFTQELVFNTTLVRGTYYCVSVTHTKLPGCAIALVIFQHPELQGLALSKEKITNANVDVIISIILLLLTLCFFCIALLIWSFLRGRGFSSICRSAVQSRSSVTVAYPAALLGDYSGPVCRNDHISKNLPPPERIFLLYSRDSKELCDCMMALGKVLKLSTQAEIIDPLNDLWGETEESKRLLSHREGGLSKWLYAHLGYNCSILLLMSPGGKLRQNALDRLERIVFDPPNVLDDIFLLGLDYIRMERANDYNNVFQISLESIGVPGETYNVGVPLAKYVLSLRLQELITALGRDEEGESLDDDDDDELNHSRLCSEYLTAIARFKRALNILQAHHTKDPQYMDRTIISLDAHSAFEKSPKCTEMS